MENIPHQLTEQIWHRFIRLQYLRGDISQLKELEHLSQEEFQDIVRYLISNGYIKIASDTRTQDRKYYITDNQSLSGITGIYIYLPENEYCGVTLKKYIDTVTGSLGLGELVVNKIPLDPNTNPPGVNVEFVNEIRRLREMGERLQSKVLINTIQYEKDENKDSDRDKFRFEIKKGDGSVVVFVAQVSGTWRAVNSSVTDGELLENFQNKITKYIEECGFALPGRVYNLRCICASTSYGVDGIQIESYEEVKKTPIKNLIYKYE